MLKSMSIHQKDSKVTIKSNFITSYLTFRNLIPTNPYSNPIIKKSREKT